MPSHHTKTNLKNSRGSAKPAALTAGMRYVWKALTFRLPHNRWLRRIILGFITLILLIMGSMYGIAQWYIHSQSSKPLQYGVSFIPDYAQSLGVNPQQAMDALINIGVKQFR